MKRTVLLIEDNEQNRYLITFLLEKNDYIVKSVTDGKSGLEIAKDLKPHIILLDIQLPVMDGYSVARALREITSLEGATIIAVTSYAMSGDREKALAAGCNGYIEKPITPETFISEIESFVLQNNSAGQL